MEERPDISVACYTSTAISAPLKNLAGFFETYGIINSGRGWRNDVVKQCFKFDQLLAVTAQFDQLLTVTAQCALH